MFRKLSIVFVSALILNLVWEHFHSVLYVHYQGGEITSFLLTRAAFFDAFIITFFAYIFRNIWYVVAVAFFFAVGLEIWAIETSRWAYKEVMPVILGVGLTPAIQLPLLAYISIKISTWKK